MKKFLKQSCIFIIFFSLIMTIIFMNNNGFDIVFNRFEDIVFKKKYQYLNDFINNHESINLILGSSIVEDSIIPDSLGPQWFSFANGSQNIYNSFKFIDYHKDIVRIDTIIIGIQPFDFPCSYIYNRKDGRPSLNREFQLFGKDSISILNQSTFKRDFQAIKEKIFPGIINLIHSIKLIVNKKKKDKIYTEDVWSRQGYSGRIYKNPINLDSLYKIKPYEFKRFGHYFYNVKSPPNFFYFDLFNSLANDYNIKVIYINTMKSKYYHKAMDEMGYNKIWNEIIDSLKIQPIEFWDYEKINTDNYGFHIFYNETHISNRGAKIFTNIIRERLANQVY